VESGGRTESEGANVFVEFRRAEAQTEFDCADVARLGKYLRDGEIAKRLVVVDTMTRDIDRAHLAIDHFLRICYAFFERARERDNFEYGTRLIDRAYRAIQARVR